MSQRKENILLLVSVAIAACLLVSGGWLLVRGAKFIRPLIEPGNPDESVKNRISFGEKFLVQKEEIGAEVADFRAAKQRGASAMAAGNYEEAARNFEEAMRKYTNAPETLIYLNNALVGDKKTYTIAVVVPISLDLGAAMAILRGVAQAQSEINEAGGINGVPLKVAIANSNEDPKITKQVASALVKNQKILGVVGHDTSTATLAAVPVYDSGKLPVVSGTASSVKLSGSSPYFFRTVSTTYVGGRALANYMLNRLQRSNVAVFMDQSGISQSLKSEFATAVSLGGGEVVAEFDLSDPDFTAAQSIKKAIERGAEALMLTPSFDSFDKALQVVTVNQKRLPTIGDMGLMYHLKTLEVGRGDAVGMVMAIAWHIDGNLNSDFPRRSRQLWDADVNWVTATVYDATQALIEALKRSPTRQGVQQALLDPDFEATGATGKIRFLPSGDRNGPVQLVEIREANPSRSGTGYDFVPIPPIP